MITESDCAYIENLSNSNDTLCLDIDPQLHISAVVWSIVSHGKAVESGLRCLREAIDAILACYPQWELWLVAGNPRSEPDNRISNYYGLWGRDKFRNVAINGRYLAETSRRSPDGVRFFGAVCFDLTQLPDVYAEMRRLDGVILIAPSESGAEIAGRMIENGWGESEWQREYGKPGLSSRVNASQWTNMESWMILSSVLLRLLNGLGLLNSHYYASVSNSNLTNSAY